MSLTVCAFRVIDDEWIDLKLPEVGGTSWLAGHEVKRWEFYGSEKSKSLGLMMLPSLAYGDIYAKGPKQLSALEAEVQILFDKFGQTDDYWHFRLGNILRAIEVAKPYGEQGMVVIW